MLRVMGDPAKLSGDQWQALLHMPFGAYSAIAETSDAAGGAPFRRFREVIEAGRSGFAEGTTGATLTDALAANLDSLWSAYHASGRSPQDAVKRGVKVLGKVPEADSVAIRDWLLVMAVGVAAATRVVGEPPVSWDEVYAIRDLAKWVMRPVPDISQR